LKRSIEPYAVSLDEIVMLSTTTATTPAYEVVWEKLPDDLALSNDPVDNINQPALLTRQLL
jgi:hypothetical protein